MLHRIAEALAGMLLDVLLWIIPIDQE